MSLKRRLILLLALFAAFGLLAAFGTIYGVQLRVDSAIGSFQRSLDQAQELDQLRIEASAQLVQLRELATGLRGNVNDQRVSLQRFVQRLRDAARFTRAHERPGAWNDVPALAARFQAESEDCLALLESGERDQATVRLATRAETEIVPELDRRLRQARAALDEARNRTAENLARTGTVVLWLALGIGVAGAGLVAIGAALIRRWLILPIDRLRLAAAEFGLGRLAYRATATSSDELGQLAGSLNQMAASLEDAQVQLQRAETMQATITLAQGVAHDFNSLLTSATGSLALLEANNQDPAQAERLRRALRACRQAASLSRELLDFARGDRGQPEILYLHETVNLILNSLDESFHDGVHLNCDFDPGVHVTVDRDQLTHIVLNLVQNAREAMPKGGELRLAIRSAETRLPDAARAARFGVLSVTDTGCGMTRQVERRIFEPFFTTKSRGERCGRGMGLAIVYAAVKCAGGFVEVESRVGVGTTFRIFLPSGEDPARPAESPAASPAHASASGLVAESM